jgi:soluble lytic murein transglycosylase-like protein
VTIKQKITGSPILTGLVFAVLSVGIAGFHSPAALGAGKVYVYRDARGGKLFTDQPVYDRKYTLEKSYRLGGSSQALTRSKRSSRSWKPRPVRSNFDAAISRKASQYQIDRYLLKALVHAESSFDPRAVSNKGAVGLMQLMPGTATQYGVRNRVDPIQNLDGGSRYLKDLLRRYRNDTRLALAAYNAGEGAVNRYGGVPPFPETQKYVDRVLRLQSLYADQQQL